MLGDAPEGPGLAHEREVVPAHQPANMSHCVVALAWRHLCQFFAVSLVLLMAMAHLQHMNSAPPGPRPILGIHVSARTGIGGLADVDAHDAQGGPQGRSPHQVSKRSGVVTDNSGSLCVWRSLRTKLEPCAPSAGLPSTHLTPSTWRPPCASCIYRHFADRSAFKASCGSSAYPARAPQGFCSLQARTKRDEVCGVQLSPPFRCLTPEPRRCLGCALPR